VGHQALVQSGRNHDGVLGALADESMALEHLGRTGRAHDHREDGRVHMDAVLNRQALFEITNGLLVFPLIPETVHQMGKGVSQADHSIETILNVILDVVVQSQPVGLLNNCKGLIYD